MPVKRYLKDFEANGKIPTGYSVLWIIYFVNFSFIVSFYIFYIVSILQ